MKYVLIALLSLSCSARHQFDSFTRKDNYFTTLETTRPVGAKLVIPRDKVKYYNDVLTAAKANKVYPFVGYDETYYYISLIGTFKNIAKMCWELKAKWY